VNKKARTLILFVFVVLGYLAPNNQVHAVRRERCLLFLVLEVPNTRIKANAFQYVFTSCQRISLYHRKKF